MNTWIETRMIHGMKDLVLVGENRGRVNYQLRQLVFNHTRLACDGRSNSMCKLRHVFGVYRSPMRYVVHK